MRIAMNTRTRLAAASALLTVLAVAGSVHAQFSPPSCVPPNCNPAVIQNVAISSSAQVASINVTGDAKVGSRFELGGASYAIPASSNVMLLDAGSAGAGANLLKVRYAGTDRFTIGINGDTTLTGILTLPTIGAGSPPITFAGDTNTGIYWSGADQLSLGTNATARLTVSNTGVIVNSGVLRVQYGTAAAPTYTFAGDTDTGIYHSAADTFNIATNGINRFQIDSTGAVLIPGNLTVQGTFSSTGGLGGDGSSITNLNATNITSGTLNDARLSTNVSTYTGGGTFTGVNSFTNAGNSFTGNGAGLTSLNASNISSGTLADARLSANVALLDRANQTFTGNNNFTGMVTAGSAALPVIGAQNLIYGNVDTTSTGALLLLQNESVDRFRVAANGDVTATSFSGVGTNLTSLNASNLSSGTVPSARISGTYANNLTFSNRTNFGSATLNVAGGTSLIYGNVDTASAGNLLLLQNESADRFRVDAAGNLILSGTITATGSLTSGGVNVCLQNGTNCPATLTGGGTANYLTKFTGTGDTVGNSLIQDDGANIGLGGAPDGSYMARVYGSMYANSVTATSVNTYLVAAGATGVVGQVVGVGSTGVAGVGGSYGVYGSSGGYGVYGVNTSAGGTGAGVYGYGDGTSPGVTGSSLAGWGGSFSSLYVTPGTAYFASAVTLNGGATLGANAGLTLGTGAADIAGANGRLFYNTTTNKFRCYENGAWVNCVNNPNAWSTINASAGTDPVPDSTADTLNITGGTAITVTGDATTDTITIANTGDANAADDITGLTAGAGISIGGAAPTLTVTNTGDTNAADDVTGSGTANYVPKFTGAQSIGNSTIYDNGTNVGIGYASPSYPLSLGSTTANTKLALYETGPGNAYGLGVIPGLFSTHLNSSGARFGWFDNTSLTTELMTLQGTGSLTVLGPIGTNGYGPTSGWGITTGGTSYGGVFYGGSYGVYGSGSTYALYGAGDGYFSGEVGIGTGSTTDYQLTVYNDSSAYAYIGRKDGGINGKGIMAYGDYYGGYFNDTNGTSYLYAAFGGYGAYGLGTTSGGYFANTSGGGITYIGGYSGGGYGIYTAPGNTYGIVAYGASTGARFYDSDNTATVFLAGASWAVEVISGNAGKPGGGSWSSTSDARTKKDVSDFKDGLSIIRKMNPVNYTYNGLGETPEGMKGIGFIAQDIEEIAPYLIVRDSKKLHPDDEEETELLMVDPSAMDFLNLNGIKELDLRIDGFEAKIEKVDELDAKLRKLEERVRELESEVEGLRD